MSRERYVVDRDGDLWCAAGGPWRCLTFPSRTMTGSDLLNVCGPLLELGGDQRNVLMADDHGAVWTGKTLLPVPSAGVQGGDGRG